MFVSCPVGLIAAVYVVSWCSWNRSFFSIAVTKRFLVSLASTREG